MKTREFTQVRLSVFPCSCYIQTQNWSRSSAAMWFHSAQRLITDSLMTSHMRRGPMKFIRCPQSQSKKQWSMYSYILFIYSYLINNVFSVFLLASFTDCLLLQSMKTKGIIGELIDLKGMAERRNVTHRLLGSVRGCGFIPSDCLSGQMEPCNVGPKMLQRIARNLRKSHPLIVSRRKYIF